MNRIILLLFVAGSIGFSGCSGGIAGSDEAERRVPLAQKARLKAEAGDLEAAVEYYRKALDEDPTLARLHLDLALLLHSVEGKKDYISMIYHYRRYLELRPDTEKRKMIENRVRIAGQSFAGGILGSGSAGNQPIIKDLEKQNESLKAEVELLKEKNLLLKQRILQRPVDKVSSAQNTADKSENPVRPGRRSYKVQPGDTLESIAVFFYKDARKADDIFNSNRTLISDRNKLIAGHVLVIP